MKVEITIPEADAQRLAQMAAEAGTTIGGLLEAFAGDLAGGQRRNGADETELAREWYDRCGFNAGPCTFLRYLAWNYGLADFLEALDVMEGTAADLDAYDGEALTPADVDDVAAIREAYDDAAQEVRSFYDEYTAATATPETWETALAGVKAWKSQVDAEQGTGSAH